LLVPSAAGLCSTPDQWVDLQPGHSIDELSRFVWVAEDSGNEWDLQTARNQTFTPNDEEIVNPGISDAVLWIRFDVRNRSDRSGSWVLSLDRVLVSIAEIYLVRAESVDHLLRSDPASFKASYRQFGTLAAPLVLDAGETASVYIRFRGANWSGLQPFLIDETAFADSRSRSLGLFLLLFGGILTLVIYGSISFALLGWGIVLLYATAQLSFLAFFAHLGGITTIYLWPDHPEFGRLFSPLTVGVFVASMAQFGRRFFDTRRQALTVDRLLLLSVALSLLGIACSPADYLLPWFDRRIALYLIYLAAIISWVTLPGLAIFATLRWNLSYWPIALAWLVMSSYMVALTMVLIGVVSTLPLGEQSYVIVYIEAFFIAIAIALRVRAIKEQSVQAQEALNRSLKTQLQESQRAVRLSEEREWALRDLAEKGRMLLAAGHDSRQLLSALRSFSRTLRRGVDDDQSRVMAREIDQIAEQMNSVLSTIMYGSRSGGIADSVVALQTTTVASLLGPLAMIHGDAARNRHIDLRIRESAQRVVCDSVLVIRVLSNLVSNSIKYTESGGGLLVGCRAGSTELRFQVWDRGVGIAADRLSALLATGAGAQRLQSDQPGSGVGLGIASALAARMGGRIEARSTPGRGSVFELVIPTMGLPADGLPSIMIFDPDPDQNRWLETQAESVGFRLRTGTAITAEKPSSTATLALIDQHHGGSDGGLRTAERMRSENPFTKVIMMTFDQSAAARAALAAHAELILYKPISAAAMLAAAARVADR
jgi:signal transduction histidine kinase